MKRLYLLLAIAAIGVAACHNENPQEVIPPVEEKEVDARLKFMDDVCALGIEVDDDLFYGISRTRYSTMVTIARVRHRDAAMAISVCMDLKMAR